MQQGVSKGNGQEKIAKGICYNELPREKVANDCGGPWSLGVAKGNGDKKSPGAM